MATSEIWSLAEFSPSVGLYVESDGVWLRGRGLDFMDPQAVRSVGVSTRLGRLLPTLVAQLVDLGWAQVEAGDVHILFDHFANLAAHEIDAFDDCVAWSPFTVELKSNGWLGGPTFSCRYRFYLGTQPVQLTRRGCFVRRGATIYRLDAQTFALIETIDRFNELTPEARQGSDAFLKFAEVKGLAEGVGVQLDRFLRHENVLVPPRVGLDIVVEDNDSISFAPRIDGVDADDLRRVFFALDDVDEVYSVARAGGERVRVVLAEEQREVLRRMQRVRHLRGVDRAKVLRDPTVVFDGVAGSVDIDLESFGPRVRGVGDFPFVVQPYLNRGTGIFEGPEAAGEVGETIQPNAGIQCTYADGRVEDIPLRSPQAIEALKTEVDRAWLNGDGTIDIDGKSIVIDEAFVRAVRELHQQVIPNTTDAADKPRGKHQYLLIYTNESDIEYDEAAAEVVAHQAVVPASLARGTVLKEHQLRGVAWLQRCFQTGRRGCLLADDMGMGKTLQILTFLAWAIEQRELSPIQGDSEVPPWNPILIIAPLVLLENETWINEMRAYFAGDGSIFQPWLTLRGTELKRLRKAQVVGRETEVGAAVLDLDRLRQYRVILTNYETITNYQHSFARMKTALSIVVTDEAQEYKIPSTKISHALKSLAPRFRIAATGTPVETRLLDVWNIFDFLQPGKLLGSASEFSRKFERAEGGDSVTALKERLRFGAADAFVLRREKSVLADLPSKIEHELRCDLSAQQRRCHVDLVRQVARGAHPFEVIHQLLRLYQHPALLPRYEPLSPEQAIAVCPKLAVVIDCLRQIRAKNEKALVFTRSLDMQHLLAGVIASQFGFEADIVNGSTRRGAAGGGARRGRKAMIQRFKDMPGFGVVILSPDVAGVGLTLTEANHVIHYGRWWNPAKESQATDRAYRIGQTRSVHVYYPIAVDPHGEFDTFDEKLHALLLRRRALAAEFLAPMPSEDDLQEELVANVLSYTSSLDAEAASSSHPTLDLSAVTPDRIDALLAVLESRRGGAQVVLSPVATNEGVNLVVIDEQGMKLVHCIWRAEAEPNADLIGEAQGMFESYRARRLTGVPRQIRVERIIVTRGDPTPRVREMARAKGLQVVGSTELSQRLYNNPCSWVDIDAMHGSRLGSVRDVQSKISSLISSLYPIELVAGTEAAGRGGVPHDEPWVDALFRSECYEAQSLRCGRTALAEQRVRESLRALNERGGRITRRAFALRLGLPEIRAAGVVTALRRLLNVDTYPVLMVDETSGTIELNYDLLRTQFEIDAVHVSSQTGDF